MTTWIKHECLISMASCVSSCLISPTYPKQNCSECTYSVPALSNPISTSSSGTSRDSNSQSLQMAHKKNPFYRCSKREIVSLIGGQRIRDRKSASSTSYSPVCSSLFWSACCLLMIGANSNLQTGSLGVCPFQPPDRLTGSNGVFKTIPNQDV